MVTAQSILEEVSKKYGVSAEQILSSSRVRPIPYARWEAMWIMNKHKVSGAKPNWSHMFIARSLGLRNHTSVIYGIREHEKRMALNEQ